MRRWPFLPEQPRLVQVPETKGGLVSSDLSGRHIESLLAVQGRKKLHVLSGLNTVWKEKVGGIPFKIFWEHDMKSISCHVT